MTNRGDNPTRNTAPDWKRKAGELSDRLARTRRHVLEKRILRGSLPLRAQTLPHRAALPENRERECRFRAASPAYARAIEDAAVPSPAQRTTLDGLTWWVPLTRPDDPACVERAIGHQDFPYRVLTQTRELGLGGIMIDIGANVGRMSVPRVILGDVTVAYCIEPDPLNYACLIRNVWDNHLRGLVLPDRAALGARNGSVRLRRSRTAGGHRVVAETRASTPDTIEVECLTLDDWSARVGIDLEQVTFVKMDAQGSEVGILHGASRVLSRRHISWQIEVDPELLRQAGSHLSDLFALLQAHFTHFIDLNRHATGERVRPIGELPSALAYVGTGECIRTDLLVCALAPVFTSRLPSSQGGRA